MGKLGPLATEADNPDVVKFFFAGEDVLVKTKFKRLKFLDLLTKDPAEALKLALADGEYQRLSEMDMTDEDFSDLMESLAGTLGATSRGNSSASPRSSMNTVKR